MEEMCRDEREMGRERDLSVRERKDFMNKEKNLPDDIHCWRLLGSIRTCYNAP